ncbi:MAG: PD-(D/E)XK nuclease-like domain-containing protein [Pirellulales bacterium]|nr:PD-(D/E)XK nuclease-like domain-containing protein [Pirellulales bacterium]
MRLGSLVHCGALEPLAIAQWYAVMPAFELDAENQTKDGKPTQSKATTYYRDKAAQFAEANRNKEIVTQAEYDNLVGLVRSLASNERAIEYLGSEGPVEVSIVWEDHNTGLLCKARIDKWQRDKQRFCDLKTCRDPLKFNRAIADYGYHRQAAFYQMGLHAVLKDIRLWQTPHLVAIEPAEPWGVRAAPVHEEWLVIGREEVNRARKLIAEAKERDEWPGYDSPDHWLPPGWYGAKESDDPIELTVGGEILAV